MAILNFPNTGLTEGLEYTGDNGVTYVYDGEKWVGRAPAGNAGTNSIINGDKVVQIDGDGNLVIPVGAIIKDSAGNPVGGGASTSTRWDATLTEPGNNCPIYAELTPDHFQAFTQQSNLGIRNDGSWNIGSNYNGTGLYGLGNTATLYSNYGDVAIRVNESQSYFTFGADGVLTLAGVPNPNFFSDHGTIKYQPSGWFPLQTVGTTINGLVGGVAVAAAFKFNKTLYEFDFSYVKPGDIIMLDNADVGYPDPPGTRGYPATITVSIQDPDNADLWIIGQANAGVGLAEGTTLWLKYEEEYVTINEAWGFASSRLSMPDNAKLRSGGSEWTFGTDGKLTFPTTVAAPVGQTTQAFGMGNLFAWEDGNNWVISVADPATGVWGGNPISISPGIEGSTYFFMPDDATAGDNAVQLANFATTGKVQIQANTHSWNFGGNGSITFPDNTVQTTAYVTGNQLIWAATDTGQGSITQAVAYDSQGNSYSLISQGNINNSGVFPATIVKRSSTGSELWKIDLGTDHTVNPWSLVCDGDNNLYAIVQRLNGSVYNNVVLKLNGANGSILWQVDIQDSQDANNMQAIPLTYGPTGNTVVIAGTTYNGNDRDFFIAGISSTGTTLTSFSFGDQWNQEAYGMAVNNTTGDLVLVGRKQSNTDNAYYLEMVKFSYAGGIAWQKSITVDGIYNVQGTDVCLLPDGNWAVLATHDLANGNYGVITMKINNTDGSVMWSREISQGCTNISSSITADSTGNIYISAMTYSGNNTPNGGFPIINRLIGAYDTTGNAMWQKYFRTFDTSEVLVDPNWWNNIGSTGKQLAVYNDRLLVATSVVTLGQSGPTGASAVVVQLTTQGENETIGAYETRNSYLTDSAVSLTVADTVFDYTTSTQTLSTGTSVSTANSGLTFSLEHTGAYVSQLKNSGKTVALETNGTLVDGAGRNVTGEFDGVTDNGNNFSNTPIGIRNASGYKRLVGLTNSAQTWFDINDVATQLGVDPTWIMGLTVEYQVTSSNFANIGSMTGQIIISSSNNSGRDISVTHSEAVLTKSNSSNDVVFANLNMWQANGWALQAVRTDSNSQQLDIIWTAKVFINASEDYC